MFGKTLVQAPQGVKRSNFAQKSTVFENISRTRRQNFLIFYMKLDNNKRLQKTYMWYSVKLLSRPLRGQKVRFEQKSTVFKISLEQNTEFFKFLRRLNRDKRL